MIWKKWGLLLTLCAALAGCGGPAGTTGAGTGENREQVPDSVGAVEGTEQQGTSPGSPEEGTQGSSGEGQQAADQGSSAADGIAGAEDQEEEGDMNRDYAAYFQDIKPTETYKGLEEIGRAHV